MNYLTDPQNASRHAVKKSDADTAQTITLRGGVCGDHLEQGAVVSASANSYASSTRFFELAGRGASGRLGVVGRIETGAIGSAQDFSHPLPVDLWIQFFAGDASGALDHGAHSGIAYETFRFPIRNHLLSCPNLGREVGLIAHQRDGFLDTSRGDFVCFAHGSLEVVYKRICSTWQVTLQALLQAHRTKFFV